VAVHRIEPGAPVGAAREQPVVCIPTYGAFAFVARCLKSVLQHTPPEIPILVADDASPDPAISSFLEELNRSGALRHELYFSRQPQNVGFVDNVNAATRSAAPGDPLILNSDCVVSAGWVEGLRDAAYSDSTVATATALTNHGTILCVPYRNVPLPRLPQELALDEIAADVARRSLRLRPRIPTAVGHCIYVRRSALDLVGELDPAFSPGYGEEVDFSQRCLLRGLVHVAADDVFVLHEGGQSFGVQNGVQAEHERILGARYPYYHYAVEATERSIAGPLPRTLALARLAFRGRLSVTIDARCLGPHITGTQIHALELIHALDRMGSFDLRVVVPPSIGETARKALDRVPDVRVLRSDEIGPHTQPSDVVHRPFQVSAAEDLQAIPLLGERFVVTQQDMIAFRNPGYFANYDEWRSYQDLARFALAIADRVMFFSRHACEDALAEDVVDRDHARVAYIGVDHHALALHAEPRRPRSLPPEADDAFLLCIGADFRHKNRVFALKLLDELQRRHDWGGYLVLAGPQVSRGSSEGDEASFLASRPRLSARVIDLRAVGEAEKAWLLAYSAGVVYPSVHEGFGLVPFEAAEAGSPCFYAPQTALIETLPADAATIVPWDAGATADEVHRLLGDEAARAANVRAISDAARAFTWDRTAAQLAEAYEEAVRAPRRDTTALGLDGFARHGFTHLPPAGGIDLSHLDVPYDVQRAFRGIASHSATRVPVFTSLKFAYRVGYVVRNRRLPH
jgi:glycosyltransferase involved in cell wall biosynthesis/GT2 family glycosyltransferase